MNTPPENIRYDMHTVSSRTELLGALSNAKGGGTILFKDSNYGEPQPSLASGARI